MRRTTVFVLATLASAALASTATAQSESQRLIAAAKEQLTSSASCVRGEPAATCATRRLDSSAALLRKVTTLPSARNEEKTEAWIWLGIGQFYAGREQVTRDAFREALALSPLVQANLEQIDSSLASILEAERTRMRQERAAQAPAPVSATPTQPATQPATPPATPAPAPTAPAPTAPAPTAPDIYLESAVEQAPELINRLRPRFPDEMRGRGYDRVEVLVELVVDTLGRIDRNSIRVVSTPSSAFTDAAIRAVREGRFRPGKLDGRAVKVRMQLSVAFEAPREVRQVADSQPPPS
jgi:TonB family protein